MSVERADAVNDAAEDFAGWPPASTIFPVKDISLAVVDGEHPFHLQQRQAAEENWAREVARNPAFFNGRLILQRKLSYEDGVIRGEAQFVPYSTFLWWRRQAVSVTGAHLFGLPVLISSDNALVAIRMSQTTANPGQVYFAAGSMDATDIRDGHADLLGNMHREVMEETGLRLEEAEADPLFFGSYQNRRVAIYRCFRFNMTAEEMAETIRNNPDFGNEVDAAVIIRSPDPKAHFYAPSMPPLLNWFFNGAR